MEPSHAPTLSSNVRPPCHRRPRSERPGCRYTEGNGNPGARRGCTEYRGSNRVRKDRAGESRQQPTLGACDGRRSELTEAAGVGNGVLAPWLPTVDTHTIVILRCSPFFTASLEGSATSAATILRDAAQDARLLRMR